MSIPALSSVLCLNPQCSMTVPGYAQGSICDAGDQAKVNWNWPIARHVLHPCTISGSYLRFPESPGIVLPGYRSDSPRFNHPENPTSPRTHALRESHQEQRPEKKVLEAKNLILPPSQQAGS